MKQLGCVLVVLGVAAAGFLGVVFFVITGSDDQSALTREVDGSLVDSRREKAPAEASRDYDYAIVYTYRVDGEAFQGTTTLSDNEWEPGVPLTLCVDPEDPTAHVVNVEGKACGSESANFGSIEQGTPTDLPADRR